MPTRIYALAKDLKLDSKELVDLCTKAGITGKGSALASLEDDEVVKLKAFLDGGPVRAKPSASAGPIVDTKAVLSSPVAGVATLPPPPPPAARQVAAKGKSAASSAEAAVAEPPAVVPQPAAPPEVASPVAPLAPPAPVVVAPAVAADGELSAPAVSPVLVAPPASVPVGGSVATQPVAAPASTEGSAAPVAAPPAIAAQAEAPAPSPSPPPAAPRAAGERPSRPMPGSAPPVDMAPRRGDSLIPKRGVSGIKVLDAKTRRPAERKPEDGGSAPPAGRGADRRPTIRVAEMPASKQPTPPPAVAEPAAQKPVLRLPSDIIKGKTRAPLEALTKKVEQERKAKETAKPGAKTPVLEPAGAGKGLKRGGREGEGLGDMGSLRAERQKARKGRAKLPGEEDEGPRRIKRTLTRVRSSGSTAAPRKDKVVVEIPCTVRTLSEAAGVSAVQVIKALMAMGVAANINGPIPDEYVELICSEMGLDVEIRQPESLEDKIAREFAAEDDPETLNSRPPIVTVLGHVDHGKTSLLDRIIGINVVSGEAGGITQHIRAYKIETPDGRHVTFVDTPGHEAFTEMRARGANVTDIAVLVVAADDGVMPQTEEAISHAKAAEVPIVVALNKIDLPGVNIDRIYQQLAAANLLPSEWGGDVEVVKTSALTGAGIPELLETLLVTAELHEYKANPERAATGMCLEAEQEPGRGVIAKVMVQNGTLNDGDIVVCGAAHGRVKAMYDTLQTRKRVKAAGPSTPVNITGLDMAPNAGDRFYVLEDIAQARDLAAQRSAASRKQSLGGVSMRVSFEDFQKRLSEGRIGQTEDVTILNLIIRADVRGSIEAILKELGKLDHPEVKLKVLQASVGGVTVADVTLAQASDAVIIGFNVIPDEAARALADDRQVEIRRYDIIYKLTDDIKALLEGKLKPEERIIEMGRALVKQVFTISRVGAVAGCQVIQGAIERSCRIRVNRDSRTIGDYAIDTLRRVKDDVKEVARGMECGIKLVNFNDVKEGDILEAYRIEEVARTL